jgi:FtsZ-interacting cell division protein ZipA
MDVNFILLKMNAFGDYIFLIIIVVASIIQAIVQKNKKEEIQKAERRKQIDRELAEDEPAEEYPMEQEEGGSIFDRMEKMLMPEPYVEEVKPKVQKTVASKKEEDALKYDIQNYKMFEGENAEPPKIEPEKKSVQTGKIIKTRLSRTFDLKKAVIYSEVLNRKYF